jgi:hypothetical protein
MEYKYNQKLPKEVAVHLDFIIIAEKHTIE